jgi:hypothetical protein
LVGGEEPQDEESTAIEHPPSDRLIDRSADRWQRQPDAIGPCRDPVLAGLASIARCGGTPESRTTHAAPEDVDACVAYAEVLADAIGRPRSEVLRNRPEPYVGAIQPIMTGSWRGKARNRVRASGYVAHSLEASLWSAGHTRSFEEPVFVAANLGEDADTTAAIAGQLAGVLYGPTVFLSGGETCLRGSLAFARLRERSTSRLG